MKGSIDISSLAQVRPHNWLVHRLMLDTLERWASSYARGTLVDIGAGTRPWAPVFAPYVDRHLGVDPGGGPEVDIVADAYHTTLADGFADTVLMTEVLEHLEDPTAAVEELRRIMAPGAYLLLTVPMMWHVHEAPRDFYRYTNFGLRHQFAEGFEIVELEPLSGFVTTFTQLACYYTHPWRPRRAVRAAQWAAQRLAYRFNAYDRTTDFSCLWCMVARRVD